MYSIRTYVREFVRTRDDCTDEIRYIPRSWELRSGDCAYSAVMFAQFIAKHDEALRAEGFAKDGLAVVVFDDNAPTFAYEIDGVRSTTWHDGEIDPRLFRR